MERKRRKGNEGGDERKKTMSRAWRRERATRKRDNDKDKRIGDLLMTMKMLDILRDTRESTFKTKSDVRKRRIEIEKCKINIDRSKERYTRYKKMEKILWIAIAEIWNPGCSHRLPGTCSADDLGKAAKLLLSYPPGIEISSPPSGARGSEEDLPPNLTIRAKKATKIPDASPSASLHTDAGSKMTNVSIMTALERKQLTDFLGAVKTEFLCKVKVQDEKCAPVSRPHDECDETVPRTESGTFAFGKAFRDRLGIVPETMSYTRATWSTLSLVEAANAERRRAESDAKRGVEYGLTKSDEKKSDEHRRVESDKRKHPVATKPPTTPGLRVNSVRRASSRSANSGCLPSKCPGSGFRSLGFRSPKILRKGRWRQ